MNKHNATTVLNAAKSTMKKHSPEILLGIGIAGMISTTVMAVKATPKALSRINDKKKSAGLDELSPVDTIKVTWKCYIPAAITGTISIICLVGASSINTRRNTALAAAYSLSEATLKEYRGKVVETLGEKKEQSIRDSIAKDKIEKDPVSNSEVIFTDKGNALCYDVVSGRYFRSDIERLKKAENHLNRQMRDEMYITLNEFYDEIGLPSIKLGALLGWHIDRGYIDLNFSSQLADDGTPCLVVDYSIAPQYDYRYI